MKDACTGSNSAPAGLVELLTAPDRSTIVINRPEKRNALDRAASRGLTRALEAARGRELPLVIRGAGDGFVAGTDLAALRSRSVGESLARGNARLFEEVARFPWPTVAMVHGWALGGGCELALACDFRVSTSDAVWGLPEVRLGVIPSAGGLTRLSALAGAGVAADLVLTGRRFDGAEAARLGLAQRVCGPGELEACVDELVATLGQASALAISLAKEAMTVSGDDARLVDALAQCVALSSVDTQERLAAARRQVTPSSA